jgi:hypothetical protein
MRVYMNSKIIDPSVEPIVLIFDNDADRKAVAAHLAGMPDKEGMRLYGQFPEEVNAKQRDNIFDSILETVSERDVNYSTGNQK